MHLISTTQGSVNYVSINSIVMLTVSCSIKLKVFFLADHTTVLHFSFKIPTSSIDFTSTVQVCFVSKGQLFELHVFTIVQYHVITIILYRMSTQVLN